MSERSCPMLGESIIEYVKSHGWYIEKSKDGWQLHGVRVTTIINGKTYNKDAVYLYVKLLSNGMYVVEISISSDISHVDVDDISVEMDWIDEHIVSAFKELHSNVFVKSSNELAVDDVDFIALMEFIDTHVNEWFEE